MKRCTHFTMRAGRSFTGSVTLTLFFSVVLLMAGCRQKTREFLPDPGFSEYVDYFTSGGISSRAAVVVKLSEVPPGMTPGVSLPGDLFRLTPPVKGEAVMDAAGVVTFKPSAPLSSGTNYEVTFSLDKLADVPRPFRKLKFGFFTLRQDFTFEDEGLYADASLDQAGISWSAIIHTADAADPQKVEKMVKTDYQGTGGSVSWVHSPDLRSHVITVDSLERDAQESRDLAIKWDGKPLDVKNHGDLTVTVPSGREFRVISAKAAVSEGQQIMVLFSDPLALDQTIEGMAGITGSQGYTWQIDGNRLILWPSDEIRGESTVTLFKGLKSADGKTLAETEGRTLFFSNLKPAVRLLGKGVIIPGKGNLSLPFEAVCLNAVDLRIIHIYASNVRQFLQENEMDGEEGIRKVGRLVYKGKVNLTPPSTDHLMRWSTYHVDLNRYINPEEGAIYRVELRFRKAYSLFGCTTGSPGREPDDADPEETEDWSGPGWYSYNYWPDDYDWEERDNPCHNSYFTSDRFVYRNILASDLGMIVKESSGYRYVLVVTNLLTALPEEKAEVTLYDFQHRLMGKAVTGKDGIAALQLEEKPFVAVARKNKQIAYLRIDDASSLSLSNFDVSGEVVQEGLKGFLYGERGVWRPGDRMFFTFILDDQQDRIPDNAPVIFKLFDSQGREVERKVNNSPVKGFYHFAVTTDPSAPTGNWHARVQAGGAVFEKRFKVETVKPNRLKADLRLPGIILAGKKQSAILQSSWLHGAPASNLKYTVEAVMAPAKTTFKGYEKFCFDNPTIQYTPSPETLFEGFLDEAGKADISLEYPSGMKMPGKMNLWMTTRIFEQGGDYSIQVQQAEFSPFSKYLGIRMPESEDGWYQTDQDYQPELVALSETGRPVPLGRVEVCLYKVDWRWWWESGEDFLARYVSGRDVVPVNTWSLESRESSKHFGLRVDFRDWQDNGRYLLYVKDVEGGQAAAVTFYMSQWGRWQAAANSDDATILAIRTDKEKYAPGEKAVVTIPSQAGCKVLISLEDGKQTRDLFWVSTSDFETSFNVDIVPGMAPTLYLYATLLQPYGSTMNDAPLRLYGVTAVTVEDPSTVLNPVIGMEEELEPGKEFRITVREQAGREMTYTLAIVDEGLLDLTNYKTPDPHGYFFAREALGVKTWDLFDHVAGAYGAQLEKAFAVGGDESLPFSGQKQANRFQPVVLYSAPFSLGRGGSKTHTFRMPNYVGSVRTMVVAGNDGNYGRAEKSVKVRQAVMLLATLPRVAGPGEEFTIPVSVFALKESTREVVVELESDPYLTPLGGNRQVVTFAAPGEKMAGFRVSTAPQTGIARVKVKATCGNETAWYEAELEIRNPNPPLVNETSRMINPGESWSPSVVAPGMKGTNQVMLELSGIPGLSLSRHFNQLIRYPHGCCEQIVSTAFAQLYLENLTELTASEKTATEENIRTTIRRLQGMQTGTGGFPLWPGQNEPDAWCTSYAGHFLALASQKGFSLPAEMTRKWRSYQLDHSRSWKSPIAGDPFTRQQETLIQAYRLYTLALAGSPERGVMNRFREEVGVSAEARWRLAAAYYLAGLSQAADLLIQKPAPATSAYPSHTVTFGSELRDKAMILETLILKNDHQGAFRLVSEIASETAAADWLSTQTTAWCFYVMARYFTAAGKEGGIHATYTLNGTPKTANSSLPLLKTSLLPGNNGAAETTIRNNGDGPLFARLSARGIPLEDSASARQSNLTMQYRFTGRKGQVVDAARLLQGTDFSLEISVSHPGILSSCRDLALTAVFPPGWEIMNERLSDLPARETGKYDYQDFRDDRVYTYFSLNNRETKTFRINLHAAYVGKYRLPAFICEGMYDNTVYARLPGQWVEVVKP